ncbi:hypothetical protein [Saccharopolyspora taberi]|uniref:Uncharacterized protein n=1 Tax=Saccharopolyspora taberi TaxID=60895 RepID=A0ABN3VM31_9PSEU
MSEDWKTQAVRDAEAALEEKMRKVEEALDKADRLSASLPEVKLTEDKIREIEELIRAGKAPAELTELQARIDAGEFTWNDVADGTALRDESVQAAFSASVANMQKAKELLDEGHDVATVISADPNRPSDDSYDDDPPDSFLR